MKWLRMLGLYFERTFEYRLQSLLWILIPIINNFTVILFWTGAKLNTSSLISYYILMTIGGSFTTSHIEYNVSEIDIKQGQLVNYLTKPISYYWIELLAEIPYRVLQSVYAIIIICGILIFFPGVLKLSVHIFAIPFIICIFILGYLLSFTMKMSFAYLSFWFKDIQAVFELLSIMAIIFSGGIMPIPWYPRILQIVCNILPFAYSGYYTIIPLQGLVALPGILSIILIQCVWLFVLVLVHNFLWRRGIKEFTAVGQ